MIKPLDLACVLLGLIGILQFCMGLHLTVDRYNLPTRAEVAKYRELQDIEKALKRIQMFQGEDNESPDAILEQIITLSKTTEDYFELDVFEELVKLSDDKDDCSASFVKYMLDILGIMEANTEQSLRKMHIYMEHFGGPKFGSCARTFERQLANSPLLGSHAGKELDNFFAIILNLPDGIDDRTMYRILGTFHLDGNAKFNNKKKLLDHVENLAKSTHYTSKEDIVFSFLSKQCTTTLVPLTKQLNVFHLARDLGGYQISNPKLMKLDEYQRICQGTIEKRRAETTANIKNSLG